MTDYQFSWQNPVLRDTIYPFRDQKLRDFLSWYLEIDLWRETRRAGRIHDATRKKLEAMAADLEAEHQRLAAALEEAIQDKIAQDKWFAKVSGSTPESTRRKYLYYLDRQISDLTERYEELIARQKRERTKMGWYPEDSSLHERYRQRAEELTMPIQTRRLDLEKVQKLRELFAQQDQLPRLDQMQGLRAALENQEDLSPAAIEDLHQDAVRWEMMEYERQLRGLTHNQMLKGMVDAFDSTPERYPYWLQYMLIHFSGMRYRSAHGSWSDPRYLLQLLLVDDLQDEIAAMDETSVDQACLIAIDTLQSELAEMTDPRQRAAHDQLIAHLKFWNQRKALLEYRTAREVAQIGEATDEEIVQTLKDLKGAKEAAGDPIPEWVWDEIVKYTPLRLETEDKDWEAFSPERWKWENRRWGEILRTWEGKDITGWRKKHAETLSLIVTRAVCNEVAEHIQHMRGLTPAGGLTAKPHWYLNQARKSAQLPAGDPEKSYFVQAPAAEHFLAGASILWLEWMAQKPSPWQVARPLSEFNLLPAGVSLEGGRRKRGGSSARGRAKNKRTDEEGWQYALSENAYVRTRKRDIKPELSARRQALKAAGVKEKDIKKEIKALKKELVNTQEEREYLRWRHEAVVVSVEDMVDAGHVLTFETGQIGLRRRRLSTLAGNPLVFAGYIPEVTDLPGDLDERLEEMLRRDRILPGEFPVPTYPKPATRKALIKEPETDEEEEEAPIPLEPTIPVLVIRKTKALRVSKQIGDSPSWPPLRARCSSAVCAVGYRPFTKQATTIGAMVLCGTAPGSCISG